MALWCHGINNQQNDEIHHLLKFLIIGDCGVGKTAICRRYIYDKFSASYNRVDLYYTKTVRSYDNSKVKIELWDIAGDQKNLFVTDIYHRNASGCAVVFDVTRISSYKSVPMLVKSLRSKIMKLYGPTKDIPIVLIANKWDFGECCVSEREIDRACQILEIKQWIKTSAKINLNIDEMMNRLIYHTFDTMSKEIFLKNKDNISLRESNPRNRRKRCKPNCCTF